MKSEDLIKREFTILNQETIQFPDYSSKNSYELSLIIYSRPLKPYYLYYCYIEADSEHDPIVLLSEFYSSIEEAKAVYEAIQTLRTNQKEYEEELKMTRYSILKNRADNIRWSIHERCKKLALEAGLSPSYYSPHAHNALLSFEAGRPWKNVDYSKVRRILYLQKAKMWKGHRILDQYLKRKASEISREDYQIYFHS